MASTTRAAVPLGILELAEIAGGQPVDRLRRQLAHGLRIALAQQHDLAHGGGQQDDARQLAGDGDLGMGGQQAGDDGGAGARQADDEHRPRRRIAMAALGGEQRASKVAIRRLTEVGDGIGLERRRGPASWPSAHGRRPRRDGRDPRRCGRRRGPARCASPAPSPWRRRGPAGAAAGRRLRARRCAASSIGATGSFGRWAAISRKMTAASALRPRSTWQRASADARQMVARMVRADALVEGERLRRPAEPPEDVGVVQVDLEGIRGEAARLLDLGQRLVDAVEGHQDGGEVGAQGRIVRTHRDRAAQEARALEPAAGGDDQGAQQVERIGLVRLLGEGAAIGRLGLAEAALALMGDALLQRRAQRALQALRCPRGRWRMTTGRLATAIGPWRFELCWGTGTGGNLTEDCPARQRARPRRARPACGDRPPLSFRVARA